MPQTSSARKSSSLGRCRPRGASRERVSCTAGDRRPQAPPGLYKPELRCHLKHCSPCSNEVWCFIISVKINSVQGEIFITLNISMPSRAKRHPSPRARQEAPGTKLFSILSPCKCLNKLILNSLHKNSGGGNWENPSVAFALQALAPSPWGCGKGGLPGTQLHPRPLAQHLDATGGLCEGDIPTGLGHPEATDGHLPGHGWMVRFLPPCWVLPFPADERFSLTSRQAKQQRN